jgi:DNA-binding FadR family transcriptional regulator
MGTMPKKTTAAAVEAVETTDGASRAIREPRPTAVGPAARRAEKVSEVVARSIAQDIATRDLPPGSMLPPEGAMLERYKVGRASLREGLRILEIQGLITIKPGPGGGPVVAAANSQDFGRMATLHYQGVRATFRDIIEARLVIEPLMARLAAERQDPDLLDELRQVSVRTGEGLEDGLTYQTSSKAFHTVVSGASGNPVLNLFACSLQDVYAARVSGFLFPIDARARVHDDHNAIIKAIQSGDAKKAERLMREHMEEFAAYNVDRHRGMLDEVVDWR